MECTDDPNVTCSRSDLDQFIASQGLNYFKIFSATQNRYLVQDPAMDYTTWTQVAGRSRRDFWTKSWDYTIENESTGIDY